MKENTKNIKKINNNVNSIFIGVGISIFFTFFSLLILACIITYTSVPENIENVSVIVINSISILVGSFFATKKQKSKGIIKGGLCGLGYVGIIYVISSFISLDFSLNLNSILMIMFSAVAGVVGGIIGINLKTN